MRRGPDSIITEAFGESERMDRDLWQASFRDHRNKPLRSGASASAGQVREALGELSMVGRCGAGRCLSPSAEAQKKRAETASWWTKCSLGSQVSTLPACNRGACSMLLGSIP